MIYSEAAVSGLRLLNNEANETFGRINLKKRRFPKARLIILTLRLLSATKKKYNTNINVQPSATSPGSAGADPEIKSIQKWVDKAETQGKGLLASSK